MNSFLKNADFAPVIRCVQVLMNTIVLIAETTLDHYVLATPEVYESLTVLTLILSHFLIAVPGVNACVQAILYAASQEIPATLHICLITIEALLPVMVNKIASITSVFGESLSVLLKSLVNVTISLNITLDDILEWFEGCFNNCWTHFRSIIERCFKYINRNYR